MNLVGAEDKKSIAETSYETTIIYERLKILKPEEFISYAILTELIGRDVQKHRTHLRTAMNRCLRRDHMVIESVRNEGIKRLVDNAVIKSQRKAITHIGKTARRALMKLGSADYPNLNREQQKQHNTLASVLGTQSYFSKESQIRKIESKVEEVQKRLPIGKTLDIFK